MKRLVIPVLVCICMCMVSAKGSAQSTYRPLVEDGKVWKGYEINAAGQRYRCDYFLSGDTVFSLSEGYESLGGKSGVYAHTYLKCYGYSERLDKEETGTYRYLGALREEKGKVYGVWAQPNDQLEEKLLFDFSMQVGDSLYCHMLNASVGIQGIDCLKDIPFMAQDYSGKLYSCYIKLSDIEKFSDDDGSETRHFHFDSFNSFDTDSYTSADALQWIEGVGAKNYYPFLSWDLMTNKDLWDDYFQKQYQYQLEDCSVQEKVLYSRANTTGVNSVQSAVRASSSDAVHDLQGRRLSGAPRKGLYIRNGKKYVVK